MTPVVKSVVRPTFLMCMPCRTVRLTPAGAMSRIPQLRPHPGATANPGNRRIDEIREARLGELERHELGEARMESPSELPPSSAPGCTIPSPGNAIPSLARTWRVAQHVEAVRIALLLTRQPKVPTVTSVWPRPSPASPAGPAR